MNRTRLSLRMLGAHAVCAALLALDAGAAAAHSITALAPFHLSPGDHFRLTVAGGTFAVPADAQVRFTPAGGGGVTTQAPEDVVANASVGVRVPAGLAVGQYDVSVRLGAVDSDPPPAGNPLAHRIWVRQRPFRFIRRPTAVHLPGAPAAAFKDIDFGDVDNDGFLDVFEANSLAGSDVDRLLFNQLGRTVRDCPGSSDFCDVTSTEYENTVADIDPSERTYDADMVDLDLDGDQDIVRIDWSGDTPIRLFINDGSGTFKDRTITRAGIGSAMLPPLADIAGISDMIARVNSGDIDGDGRPDLLLCDWAGDSGQNVLLLNRLHTTGRFELANNPACDPASPTADGLCKVRPESNRGCGFAHIDGDTRLDIYLPTMNETRLDRVLLNTGNNAAGIPQFTVHDDWVKAPGGATQAPTNGGIVKVADLDGDGDDDVVVAAPRSPDKRRILWNDGGTRLVELADDRYAPFGDSYDSQLADLDRDGDLDILFSPEIGANHILVNRGGRNAGMKFEEVPASAIWHQESPGGDIPTSASFALAVSPGDYDLDGDHDLLTGGGSPGLWRNDLFNQPGEDRDWIFALDRTRSMISGRDFFEPAKNVLKTFLRQRRPGDLAGLVTFDYTGSDPFNPNAADDANKAQVEANVGARTMEELQDDVEDILIGGCSGNCTAIGWAIKTARDVAVGAPDALREKVVVLLTDGEQNQGPHPDTIIPTIPSHVRLYTIALGVDTDDRMLSALATNGGKFYFAGRSTDYTSVQAVLREVDEDLEGDATGKQPIPAVSRLVWSPGFRELLARSPLLKGLRVDFEPSAAVLSAVEHFVVDPSDRQVRFTLSWRHPSRTNRMVLTDPKGRTHPLPGDDRVRETRGDKAHVIEVADPLSGVWQLRPLIAADTGPYKATATASSALRVAAKPRWPLFYLNEPLELAGVLSQAVPGAQVQVQLLSPSKRVSMAAAQVGGNGAFTIRTGVLSEPGTYRVELALLGPPQRPFVRTWQSAVHVAQPTPEETDLRKAALALDRNELQAGGALATATLRLARRDGQPLVGARVSFVPTLGAMVGGVQDHGDGRYSQRLKSGPAAGKGRLHARVGLWRLPAAVDYEVTAAGVHPGKSRFTVMIGTLKLCSEEPGSFGLRVLPVDAFGNPLRGAKVEIEQTSGPRLRWDGPVSAIGQGELYERRFRGPEEAGTYVFSARVNGTALPQTISLPVYEPTSAEGILLGCFERPERTATDLPCVWIVAVLLLLLLLIVVFWLRRRPAPAGA